MRNCSRYNLNYVNKSNQIILSNTVKIQTHNLESISYIPIYDKTFPASGRGTVLETTVTKPRERTGAHWGSVREGERDQSKTWGWGR